ncbi:fosfomycin resistance glutathione transferase [Silvimonas iriomotensis]|nr:fosfomycin resistance glutathione transferase [Silvimonas iriomotensis]
MQPAAAPQVSGINHLTLAVTDVARALRFYVEGLGARLHAQWDGGAYLTVGGQWLCLSLDADRAAHRTTTDYTHLAFSVTPADFAPLCARLAASGAPSWKDNRSEGDSFYFLDPDGHRLELHVGDLASRLASCRVRPYAGMQFY